MPAIQLVIFDVAGTIIQDHGEVVDAFSTALEENGIPFSHAELKQWKGASKREVIRHFVEAQGKGPNAERVECTYQGFRQQLEQLYRNRVEPIPGAEACFLWCRDRGIRLATTTGFYREVNELILERTGWSDLFIVNVTSSDVNQGRPSPEMIFRAMKSAGIQDVREVMNIGDTPLDLRAGTSAGVRGVVGVLTGTHRREELEREPHTHIMDSVAEVPSLIEREFSS